MNEPRISLMDMLEQSDPVRDAIEKGYSVALGRDGRWTAYDGLGHVGEGATAGEAVAALEQKAADCRAGVGLCEPRRREALARLAVAAIGALAASVVGLAFWLAHRATAGP